MGKKKVIKRKGEFYSVTVPVEEAKKPRFVIEVLKNVLEVFEIEYRELDTGFIESGMCEYCFTKKESKK